MKIEKNNKNSSFHGGDLSIPSLRPQNATVCVALIRYKIIAIISTDHSLGEVFTLIQRYSQFRLQDGALLLVSVAT